MTASTGDGFWRSRRSVAATFDQRKGVGGFLQDADASFGSACRLSAIGACKSVDLMRTLVAQKRSTTSTCKAWRKHSLTRTHIDTCTS